MWSAVMTPLFSPGIDQCVAFFILYPKTIISMRCNNCRDAVLNAYETEIVSNKGRDASQIVSCSGEQRPSEIRSERKNRNMKKMEKKSLTVRKRLIAILLLAVMLLGTACGGTDTDTSAQGTSSEDAAASETNSGYQEHIVIGSNGGITTTDPQMYNNVTHAYLFQCTHERLITYNFDTKSLEPVLAESYGWVDDTTYEIKLRQGVTFHNGNPLTADDVLYTFKRGMELYPSNFGTLNGLDRMEATDDDTIRMYLTSHITDWPDIMATREFYIIDRESCEEDPKNGPSIGTGPFMITNMVPSDIVETVRYDDYWGEPAKTAKLDIRYIGETSARLIALQNSEIDVCIQPSNNELSFVEEDPNLKLIETESNTATFLGFNTAKAPTDDVNLRLAVAYCLNQSDIMQVGAEGMGVIGISNWGPSTYGYYDGFGVDGQAYGQDLEKAKEYAAKASTDTFKLAVSTPERKRMAEVIQAECAQIGINVIIDEVETAAITNMMRWDVAEHEAYIYNCGWNAYGDDCRRIYYPEQGTNRSLVTDDRIIELIDTAAVETDDAARKEMYQEIQVINHDQAYNIPLYFGSLYNAAKAGVEGVMWSPKNDHDFSKIYIAAQ